MNTVTLNFRADNQTLKADGGLYKYASNTVAYIRAVFDLGENWTGFDSVRAVWHTEFNCISTVLDGQGVCVVPHEVLSRYGEVCVNLVGSNVEDDELTDRLTTYPIKVIFIDANARICGTETAEVTPSQFEQYIAIVEQIVGTVKDIDRTELNADYTLTIYYTDGTSDTVGPIRGEQGPQGETGPAGNGISKIEKIGTSGLVDTYRITYTNGSHYDYTVTNGAKGETGNGIESIYLTGTSGAVKTYTILFTDGTTFEYQVTDGEVTLAEFEQAFPTDTASGAIASFPDGTNLFPAKSLVADINPIQDLHGYDSPWVGGAGKNKAYMSISTGSIGTGGQIDVSSAYDMAVAKVEQGKTYTVTTNDSQLVCGFFNDEPYIGATSYDSTRTVQASKTFTAPINGYIAFRVLSGYTTYQCEEGISATSYEPYSNICPISGRNSVGVVNGGVNLFNGTFNTLYKLPQPIAKDTYVCASCADSNSTQIYYYDSNGTQLDYWSLNTQNTDGRYYRTFMISQYLTADAYYIKFVNGNPTDLQFEIVDNASAKSSPYQAPISYTTTLPSTVYGGTLDVVSGVLTVDRAIRTFNGTESAWEWPSTRPIIRLLDMKEGNSMDGLANWLPTVSDFDTVGIRFGYGNKYVYICQPTNIPSVTDLASFKTYLGTHNLTIVYPLATPQTIQLTPTQVQTLLGTNNIFADSGDVTVEYVADIQKWVEKKLAEL